MGVGEHFSTRLSEVAMRFLFALMKNWSFWMRAALAEYILAKISLSSCLLHVAVHTPPGHLRQHVGHGDGRSTDMGPVNRTTVGGTAGGGGTAWICRSGGSGVKGRRMAGGWGVGRERPRGVCCCAS